MLIGRLQGVSFEQVIRDNPHAGRAGRLSLIFDSVKRNPHTTVGVVCLTGWLAAVDANRCGRRPEFDLVRS